MFRFTHALVLVAVMASAAFAQSPYLFTPSGRDDAAALRAALIAYRWVQINGTDIRIDAPINLETDDGVPLHNILVEPAPGINRTTIHTAIVQDTNRPLADRSPFNYNGGFEPASFLTTGVPAGVMSITVRDPAQLVWATDWPFVGYESSITYAQCVQWIEAWIPDSATRRVVLAETPARLFHFV